MSNSSVRHIDSKEGCPMTRWMIVPGLRFAVPLIALFSLAGCGGGGSGGGSSALTASAQVFVGTYRGTENVTATAGPASASQRGPTVVTVSPQMIVTVGSFGSAPLSGNSFTITAPASKLNGPGLTCPQGTITFAGTFIGTTVNGTSSSAGMVCNGISAGVTGTFTATLQAEVRSDQADGDATTTFRSVLIRALAGP
jgi:hypothetical protein